MSSFPDDADIVALVLAKLPLSELLRACAVCRLWADTGERAVEERQPSSMYQPQLTCGSNFRVGEVVDAFVRVEGTGSMLSGCFDRRRMSDAQGTWKRGTIVELEPTAAEAALKAEALAAKKEAALIKSEAAAANWPFHEHGGGAGETEERNVLFVTLDGVGAGDSRCAPAAPEFRSVDSLPVRRPRRSTASADALQYERRLHLFHFDMAQYKFLNFSFDKIQPQLGPSSKEATEGAGDKRDGDESAASEVQTEWIGERLCVTLSKGQDHDFKLTTAKADGGLQVMSVGDDSHRWGIRPGMCIQSVNGEAKAAPKSRSEAMSLNKELHVRPLQLLFRPADITPRFEWHGLKNGLINGDSSWFCQMCSCTWDSGPDGPGFYTPWTSKRRRGHGCPVCHDNIFQTCLLKSCGL